MTVIRFGTLLVGQGAGASLYWEWWNGRSWERRRIVSAGNERVVLDNGAEVLAEECDHLRPWHSGEGK